MASQVNLKPSENVLETWCPENKKKQAMLGIAILVLGIGLFLSGAILTSEVPHHLLPNGDVAPLSHHWKVIRDLGLGGFWSGMAFAVAGVVLYVETLHTPRMESQNKTPRMESQNNPFYNRISINS